MNAAWKYVIVGRLSLFYALDREPPVIRPIPGILSAAAGVFSFSELFQLDLPHWDGRNPDVLTFLSVGGLPTRVLSPQELEEFRSHSVICASSLFAFPPNTAFYCCSVNGGWREECLSPLFLEQTLHNCSSEQWIRLPILSE